VCRKEPTHSLHPQHRTPILLQIHLADESLHHRNGIKVLGLKSEMALDVDQGSISTENIEVLPLLLASITFAFLLLGSVVFVACLPLPQTRRFALSAALWCAMWGPCTLALLLCAGLGIIASAFITKTGDVQSIHAPYLPHLLAVLGWGYLTLGVLVTATVASATAWLHQVLTRRFTFALFRLYATLVSAGIGSVFGWCLGLWLLWANVTRHVLPWWSLGTLFLVVGFGTAAYKNARELRGEAPTNFTWISPEEFAGTHSP
jgi:hypothetical protein